MRVLTTRPSPLLVIPIHLLIGCFAIYLYRFGYGFGTSDQDEFLPYLLHLLNPELFNQDWFVQAQISSFGIRTYTVYTIFPFAKLFSPFYAVTILYVVCWFGISAGLYLLAYEMSKNRLVAIASVVVSLVLTPFWTLGGNDLVHSMLVPSMFAWMLGVWALAMYVRNNIIRPALFAGLSTLFQALVGLQLALLIGLLLLFDLCTKKTPGRVFLRKAVLFSGFFAVCASPALIPLIDQQLSPSNWSAAPDQPSLFYIMAAFRNPHHYLFHSFSEERTFLFGILLGIGTITLVLGQLLKSTLDTRFATGAIVSILIVCAVAYVGTELYPILFVAKLQLFKLTVVGKIILIIVTCSFITHVFPERVQRSVERLLFNHPFSVLGILIALYLGLLLTDMDRFTSKIYPFSHRTDEPKQIAFWSQRQTSPNAVFAIPPSWSGFRSHSHRSIVINHKSFPYKDPEIYTWFERLTAMAPLDLPERSDASLIASLDSAYEALPLDALEKLEEQYGFEYLVRSTPLPSPNPLFKSILVAGEWRVYRRIGASSHD